MNSEMKSDATQFIHFIDELKNEPTCNRLKIQ